MSNKEDNSLLDFLKKKSLFTNSPTKNLVKKSRSKSKDKDSIIRKINEKDFEDSPEDKKYQNIFSRELKIQPQNNFYNKEYQPNFQDNNYRKDYSKQPQSQRIDFTLQDKNNTKFLNGLTSYAMNFQSARLESAQCLQSLSIKLNTEISNVNYRIDQFRTNMSKLLNNELKSLRQQILRHVDDAFKESERSIMEYMKFEEQKHASDLIKIRQILERQYIKVEAMKEEINQSQWRKVAGELLATELQKNIEELVKKSGNTQIGRWEIKNISGQRLKPLEIELSNLVRLKQ